MNNNKICKECLVNKNLDNFYKHPQGVLGRLPRCIDCIKKGRKTERERIMARVIDVNRNKTLKRKETQKRKNKIRIINNPEKKEAMRLVNYFYRKNNNIKPKICYNCNSTIRIELHHEDYNYPNIVIPLCKMCHAQHHSGIISINKNNFINLPF